MVLDCEIVDCGNVVVLVELVQIGIVIAGVVCVLWTGDSSMVVG